MRFSEEELNDLIIDYKNGMTPKALSEKYKRSAGAIIVKLQSLGVFTPTKYRFTQEDIEYLKEHYPVDDIDDIIKHFPKSTKQSIVSICSKYNIKAKSSWTESDLDILKEYYYVKSLDEIYDMINGRHSKDAIQTKAFRYFGYSKDRSWTDDEIIIIKKYYSIEPIEDVMKRLPSRTRNSIISKSTLLGLTSYHNLNTKWTKEESDFLLNNWENCSDKQIGEFLNKNRRSVKTRRQRLGLLRSIKHYNEATYENLNKYLRGNVGTWKSDSMKNCSYQCVLTGSKMFVVHHLYSFSSIVNEVLNENDFELKDSFSDYTEDELIFIQNKFLEKHNSYPLGVCVRDDLHKLFHSEYGTVVTPDMWNDFVDNYKKGKYIN